MYWFHVKILWFLLNILRTVSSKVFSCVQNKFTSSIFKYLLTWKLPYFGLSLLSNRRKNVLFFIIRDGKCTEQACHNSNYIFILSFLCMCASKINGYLNMNRVGLWTFPRYRFKGRKHTTFSLTRTQLKQEGSLHTEMEIYDRGSLCQVKWG